MQIESLIYSDKLWQVVAEYAQECSWRAGATLAKQMKECDFSDWERVFAALDGDHIAGYCTLAKTDCIPDIAYSPYIGFVFVGEQYRGNRLSEKLILSALAYAKGLGFDKVYLISDHINLYEKYGFMKADEKEAPWGAMETIFMHLT
ncbi:GNAT family N-acetyltransferase [Paenibacillus sp. V4I7]|uniref:GNAT family N-acetyltransferase n=1 Tax=Paenibacillus sp. V4I7 TaxID=3042307 RepID=UPI002789FB66|nr:GNAT family N-acetyltransferase [Paenibacillus sp. V4I7]MDQ0897682.1 putative N-acetyltransferase YhbS [Paenibacillus sp. V4I7]